MDDFTWYVDRFIHVCKDEYLDKAWIDSRDALIDVWIDACRMK